jgi:hypothetical protein
LTTDVLPKALMAGSNWFSAWGLRDDRASPSDASQADSTGGTPKSNKSSGLRAEYVSSIDELLFEVSVKVQEGFRDAAFEIAIGIPKSAVLKRVEDERSTAGLQYVGVSSIESAVSFEHSEVCPEPNEHGRLGKRRYRKCRDLLNSFVLNHNAVQRAS